MSKPWFRLYAEFLSDPKMQLLAFEDQRHYIGILCLKCNGTLETLSIGPEHFERMVSKALGLDPASGAEAKRRLMEVGLITESWQPRAWDKRQYESDSSTARVHKWREEKTRNVTETLPQRSRSDSEQIQNRSEKIMAGRNPPDWFEEFKQTYPKRAGDQQWRKAISAGSARIAEGHQPSEFIAGAARYAQFVTVTGKASTEYVQQAARFLGPGKPFLLPWSPPAVAESATDEIKRLNSGGSHAPAGRVFEAEPSRTGLVPLLGNVRR